MKLIIQCEWDEVPPDGTRGVTRRFRKDVNRLPEFITFDTVNLDGPLLDVIERTLDLEASEVRINCVPTILRNGTRVGRHYRRPSSTLTKYLDVVAAQLLRYGFTEDVSCTFHADALGGSMSLDLLHEVIATSAHAHCDAALAKD